MVDYIFLRYLNDVDVCFVLGEMVCVDDLSVNRVFLWMEKYWLVGLSEVVVYKVIVDVINKFVDGG